MFAFCLSLLLVGIAWAQGFESGPYLLDTSIVVLPAPYSQATPAVASDGTNFMAVWEDLQWGSYDICAARVGPDGVMLDTACIPITAVPTIDERTPALAFGCARFLVVWPQYRNGSWEICGTRVTPDGVVLDPDGIAISNATISQSYPAVAFDGKNFFVVWGQSHGPYTYDIYGTRVTPDGGVLDPAGIAISTAASDQFFPAVAFDGANFLVAWSDTRTGAGGIYGARVTPVGAVLDPTGIPISTASNGESSLDFDGENFLVVWGDGRNASLDIYGARVTPAGAVLDTEGIVISNAANDQGSPAIAFDGENFLVVWHDSRSGQRDICGARVTPDAIVLDSFPDIPISTAVDNQDIPAVAIGCTDFLVVWRDRRSGVEDICGSRVTPDGVVLEPAGLLTSTTVNSQWSPAVASDGADFQAVWEDFRDGPCNIYGVRVTTGGAPDSAVFLVVSDTDDQKSPAIAFGINEYLVAWKQCHRRGPDSDIYATRISPSGEVLDPYGWPISRGLDYQESPALAFDATNFLAVWCDWRNPSRPDIYGARVATDGGVLDNHGIAISVPLDSQMSPAVAFNGDDFLVVWRDRRSKTWDIYGARVTRDGVVLDSSGIPIATGTGYQFEPAVASDGNSFLVTWQDSLSGGWNIHGARVTREGVVPDPSAIPICTAAGDQVSPTVAFDGSRYLVVWSHERSDLSYDICGARVSIAGEVIDTMTVVAQEGSQYAPALATSSGSHPLLAYQGWVGTNGVKTYDNYRIWSKANPIPGIEEASIVPASSSEAVPTVVRGVLFLSGDRGPETGDLSALMDVSGRTVMHLRPGANDVRTLAPGVYFVRGEGRGAGDVGPIRKVVLTR